VMQTGNPAMEGTKTAAMPKVCRAEAAMFRVSSFEATMAQRFMAV
jgi:hypothetical protein